MRFQVLRASRASVDPAHVPHDPVAQAINEFERLAYMDVFDAIGMFKPDTPEVRSWLKVRQLPEDHWEKVVLSILGYYAAQIQYAASKAPAVAA